MDEQDQWDTDEPLPVETVEQAAVIISGFVSQGRIGPTRPGDFEAETLLALLAILVQRSEPRR